MLKTSKRVAAERPEAFEAFFTRFLGLKAQRVLHAHERLTYLLFCIHALQSLENSVVWGQVRKLVSLSLWHALSPPRLQVSKPSGMQLFLQTLLTQMLWCTKHCRAWRTAWCGAKYASWSPLPVACALPTSTAGEQCLECSFTYNGCSHRRPVAPRTAQHESSAVWGQVRKLVSLSLWHCLPTSTAGELCAQVSAV